MKRGDFMRLAGRVAAWWPHSPWTDDAAAAYFDDVKDLDGEQVATAVKAWYRDGEKFPPTGANLRRKVIALAVDAPTWAQVKAHLCKPPARQQAQSAAGCPAGRCDGSTWVLREDGESVPCGCQLERIDRNRGRQVHPLIAEFAEEVGAGALRDVWHDRIAEAQIRTMWEQFIERHATEAAYADLADAGLPAIERANRRGLASIGAALRRALPAGREAA